jgi:hypothetical protein
VPMPLIGQASNVIRRVFRATLQAETQAPSAGVGEAFWIRTAVADAHERV